MDSQTHKIKISSTNNHNTNTINVIRPIKALKMHYVKGDSENICIE